MNLTIEVNGKINKVKVFGDPISRSLNKNNARLDLGSIGTFAYVDIENFTCGGACVGAIVAGVVVLGCITAAAITGRDCVARIKDWVDIGFTGNKEEEPEK